MFCNINFYLIYFQIKKGRTWFALSIVWSISMCRTCSATSIFICLFSIKKGQNMFCSIHCMEHKYVQNMFCNIIFYLIYFHWKKCRTWFVLSIVWSINMCRTCSAISFLFDLFSIIKRAEHVLLYPLYGA